jgi:hypothetical protein
VESAKLTLSLVARMSSAPLPRQCTEFLVIGEDKTGFGSITARGGQE